MLNVELVEKKLSDGKRTVYSSTKWIPDEISKHDDVDLKIYEYEDDIKNKSIKITCNDDQYIFIPNFSGLQHSGASEDNYYNKEMAVYDNKPREMYIPLSYALIDFKDHESIFKRHIVHVQSDQNYSVEKYQVFITLNLKNNGLTKPDKYFIEPKVYIYKISDSNLIFNTINIGFYGFLIFSIMAYFNLFGFSLSFGYGEMIIIIAWASQYFYRFKYMRKTSLNKVIYYIKYKYRKTFKKSKMQYRKDMFTEKRIVKRMRDDYNEHKIASMFDNTEDTGK